MPSVEMRRTTRVFGARVLRSGRRLFTTQEVLKHMRRAPLAVADAEEGWIELLDRGGGGGRGDVEFKENQWLNSKERNKEIDELMDTDDGELDRGSKLVESREVDSTDHDLVDDDGDCGTGNKHWGLVYSRKRKRNDTTDCGSSDKKFGKKFFRKHSRKKYEAEDLPSVLPPKVTTDIKEVLAEPCSAVKPKSRKKKVMRILVAKPTSLNLPNLRPRNGIAIHHGIQKRRSSLRSRKQRKSSSLEHLKSAGSVDLAQDGVPFFPIKSNPEVCRPIRRPSSKEIQSTLVEITQNLDSASCNANVLVIESDRCYREGGAVITIEMLSPKQWFLVVKRNGVERFRVEAHDALRPCFCNRVTRAIIWAGGDESWKLEFPDRKDWVVFKELYRRCSERTVRVQASVASIIPVPRVKEVSGYAEEKYVPFKMPDSYISSRGDEVSRVLEKSDPVYEMDSDDEEWLNKFNIERVIRVDEDTFEKIVDAFERGIYGSPEDYSDVNLAVDRCSMLASKDVLEAIYGYWVAKRKKQHSALVRVFQFYKAKKREQLNIKAVLRKKRSFRHRGIQLGRGKQLTFLKAVLYENTTATEAAAEDATTKVQVTEAAANKAEQAAIMKRQKAQLLMEIADLLTYKAAMALKLAEARVTSGSVDDSCFEELFPGEYNSSGST